MTDDRGMQQWQEVGQWEQEQLVVVHVCPPIPVRHADYMAARKGYDADSIVGWGATPEEAIEDLKEQEQ